MVLDIKHPDRTLLYTFISCSLFKEHITTDTFQNRIKVNTLPQCKIHVDDRALVNKIANVVREALNESVKDRKGMFVVRLERVSI
jgi:hypothetical protein